MSQYKRKHPERKNGKRFLPRNLWKNNPKKYKRKTKRKRTIQVEYKLVDPNNHSKYIAEMFGNGNWIKYKKYHSIKSAQQAVDDLNRGAGILTNICNFKYRIKKES